jgi:hypothetical protein
MLGFIFKSTDGYHEKWVDNDKWPMNLLVLMVKIKLIYTIFQKEWFN